MADRIDIDEIERLLERATPGPWRGERGDMLDCVAVVADDPAADYPRIASVVQHDDVELIVALRNHGDALVAAARERDRLRAALVTARDAIAAQAQDAFGEARDAEGMTWPIRDELVHRLTAALRGKEGSDGE